MRNKKGVIRDLTITFIQRMYKQQTRNGVEENIHHNLIDSTLDGGRDMFRICLSTQNGKVNREIEFSSAVKMELVNNLIYKKW
jgi:hypothetical protein